MSRQTSVQVNNSWHNVHVAKYTYYLFIVNGWVSKWMVSQAWVHECVATQHGLDLRMVTPISSLILYI